MDKYVPLVVNDASGFVDMQRIEATIAFVDHVTNTVYLFGDTIKRGPDVGVDSQGKPLN
jgi:hypothetical protein